MYYYIIIQYYYLTMPEWKNYFLLFSTYSNKKYFFYIFYIYISSSSLFNLQLVSYNIVHRSLLRDRKIFQISSDFTSANQTIISHNEIVDFFKITSCSIGNEHVLRISIFYLLRNFHDRTNGKAS